MKQKSNINQTQWVNKPIKEVFAFFKAASNLEQITPPYLQFKILNMDTEKIQKNSIINYQLKLYGVPFKWQTKISDFVENKMFIDEQVIGPYKKWVHTHTFYEKDGGTLICDHVDYTIPGGVFGNLVLGALIRKDLAKIFKYRTDFIAEYFK